MKDSFTIKATTLLSALILFSTFAFTSLGQFVPSETVSNNDSNAVHERRITSLATMVPSFVDIFFLHIAKIDNKNEHHINRIRILHNTTIRVHDDFLLLKHLLNNKELVSQHQTYSDMLINLQKDIQTLSLITYNPLEIEAFIRDADPVVTQTITRILSSSYKRRIEILSFLID